MADDVVIEHPNREKSGAKATKAIDYPADPGFCDEYHANDPDFWKKVYYWITPVADCGDDRGSVCKDNNDWIQAWTEIKG